MLTDLGEDSTTQDMDTLDPTLVATIWSGTLTSGLTVKGGEEEKATISTISISGRSLYCIMYRVWLPTVHVYHDPLGHGRRDSVGGDAQVRAHVGAGQATELKHGAFDLLHCIKKHTKSFVQTIHSPLPLCLFSSASSFRHFKATGERGGKRQKSFPLLLSFPIYFHLCQSVLEQSSWSERHSTAVTHFLHTGFALLLPHPPLCLFEEFLLANAPLPRILIRLLRSEIVAVGACDTLEMVEYHGERESSLDSTPVFLLLLLTAGHIFCGSGRLQRLCCRVSFSFAWQEKASPAPTLFLRHILK